MYSKIFSGEAYSTTRGCRAMSNPAMRAGTCSRACRPVKRTRSTSPSAAAWRSRSERAGPSPTTIRSIGTLSPAAAMAAMTVSRPCQSRTKPTKPRITRSLWPSRRGRSAYSARLMPFGTTSMRSAGTPASSTMRFRAPVTTRTLSAERQTYASSRVASPRSPRPPNRARSSASGAFISRNSGTPCRLATQVPARWNRL